MTNSKCFVGYTTGNIIPGLMTFGRYVAGESSWKEGLHRDVGRNGHSVQLILRLFNKDKKGDVTYYLPEYDHIYGFPAGMHTCRESLRSLYTKIRLRSKEKPAWVEKHIALGFRTFMEDTSDVVRRAKIACKVLNVIEDGAGMKEKTELDICCGDDLFFVNEHGMKPPTSDSENLQDRDRLREFVKLVTTFYMYRPARCWYQTSYTMSLFFLIVRNVLADEIKDDFDDFKSYASMFESAYFLNGTMFQDAYSGSMYDPFINEVNYSLSNKGSDFTRLRSAWPYTVPLLSSIEKLRDSSTEYKSTSDSTFGITNFIHLIRNLYKDENVEEGYAIHMKVAKEFKKLIANKV